MRAWLALVGAIAVVFLLWVASAVVIAHLAFLKDWEARGQFGDTFGAVNALFSGLAFAGLLFTIWQQRSQIDMQREELALQREELKLQRLEMEASRGELARQAGAQMALVEATITQIEAAAINATIQARRVESEDHPQGSRQRHWEAIDKQSDQLKILAAAARGNAERAAKQQ